MTDKCFHIALSIWLFTAFIGFAENFQGRPALAGLNELVNQGIVSGNAVRERDVVVNRTQTFFPYCGVWQSYFASLQSELEYLAPLYIDHVSGPLNAGKTGFLYFTLATWRSAAGLNTNGFRRTGWDGVFSYGHAQSGDIIGLWIYEDIQNGFSALKWTYWTDYTCPAYSTKNSYGGGIAGSGCIADWETQAWSADTYSGGWGQYQASSEVAYNWGWLWWAHRTRAKFTVSFPAACVDRAMDVYIAATPMPNYGFYDYDDWGVTSGEFVKYDEVSTFSGTTYTSGWMGDIDVCPVALCPEQWYPATRMFLSWNASPYYIAKWDFTH